MPDPSPGSALPIDLLRRRLFQGLVIPAHPLALHSNGTFDESRQRDLTRYYTQAGAGGVAVGVHTTQFAIRQHGLLQPVLQAAAETARTESIRLGTQPPVLIAGVCGQTGQAIREASLAKELGYHTALLSLAALPDATDEALLRHCQSVSEVLPLFGFYLQPAVGGRRLSIAFWREFFQIENVAAVKVAPFNRYQTLDVLRALAGSGRSEQIALYTGNDDSIVVDLLTQYEIAVGDTRALIEFHGGLLGQWACGTAAAVQLLQQCQKAKASGTLPASLLTVGAQLTELNAAVFDAANDYRGCIAGIHYVLQQQGLLDSLRCLDPSETLSPDQAAEIDRALKAYPHLQ